MATTQPTVEDHEQHVDDLTQIHGIGQAMARKLNQAGIVTFAQLGNLSPEKLADLFAGTHGWSAERERDLIRQARELMGKETLPEQPAPVEEMQYYAQFSVDLLLDSQKRVRRTHIIHIQSRKEEPWADWDKDRLVDFILTTAKNEPVLMRAETVEFQPGSKDLPQDEKQKTMGDLNISEALIQALSGRPTHWLVTAGQPFEVRLTLDMSKTSFSAGTPLQYQTEIHVKNLADGKRQSVGEEKGALKSRNLVPLVVKCNALPQGSYRLETSVILAPDLEDPNPRSRLVALTEGKVFRVN